MKDEMILSKIAEFGKVKSVVTRDTRTGKYIVSIMKCYSGGKGLGYMGCKAVLDIEFNTKAGAENLHCKIQKKR